MPGSMRKGDPYFSYRFKVEIKGVQVGAFSEVTGLQVEIETHDYREGGVNEFIHRVAGPARYPNHLIFKHGLMDGDLLWGWMQDVVAGDFERHNGSVILMNSAGDPVWRWNFKDAYPVRWAGPDLRAGTAEVALETLELVHRGISKG
jgi:phage tail-like protein